MGASCPKGKKMENKDISKSEFAEEYQCVIEVWLWLLGMTRF